MHSGRQAPHITNCVYTHAYHIHYTSLCLLSRYIAIVHLLIDVAPMWGIPCSWVSLIQYVSLCFDFLHSLYASMHVGEIHE